MKVTRVLHVSVNAHRALDETRSFYQDLFGLDSKSRPEIPGIGGHWFALGESELHLVDAPAGAEAIRPAGNHYCVAVDDLDAAIADLEGAVAVPLGPLVDAPGEMRLEFMDQLEEPS